MGNKNVSVRAINIIVADNIVIGKLREKLIIFFNIVKVRMLRKGKTVLLVEVWVESESATDWSCFGDILQNIIVNQSKLL